MKIYLPIVTDVDPLRDAVITVDTPNGEFMKGDGDENLACGACKKVIIRGMSTADIFDQFGSETGRLVLRHQCGAAVAVNVAKVSA
jgi:hypothetical protein